MSSTTRSVVSRLFVQTATSEARRLPGHLGALGRRTRQADTNIIQLPKAWFQWALCGFSLLTAAGMGLRAVELILSGRDVRAERQPA